MSFYMKTSISPKESICILKDKDSAKLNSHKKSPNSILDQMFIIKTYLKRKNIIFIKREEFDKDVVLQAEIQIKYSGYINKELKNVEKINRLENLKIPKTLILPL